MSGKMIYTSRINYRGDGDIINITRKSGERYIALAPTYKMIMGYKLEEIKELKYKTDYADIVFESVAVVKKMLEETGTKVVLVCYCNTGDFCHRVLLAKFIEMVFGFKYGGEI